MVYKVQYVGEFDLFVLSPPTSFKTKLHACRIVVLNLFCGKSVSYIDRFKLDGN